MQCFLCTLLFSRLIQYSIQKNAVLRCDRLLKCLGSQSQCRICFYRIQMNYSSAWCIPIWTVERIKFFSFEANNHRIYRRIWAKCATNDHSNSKPLCCPKRAWIKTKEISFLAVVLLSGMGWCHHIRPRLMSWYSVQENINYLIILSTSATQQRSSL